MSTARANCVCEPLPGHWGRDGCSLQSETQSCCSAPAIPADPSCGQLSQVATGPPPSQHQDRNLASDLHTFHLCVTPSGRKVHPRLLQGFHLPPQVNIFGNLAFNLLVPQFLLLFASFLPSAVWMQSLHSSSVLMAGLDPHCHLGASLLWIRKKSPIISASAWQCWLNGWTP